MIGQKVHKVLFVYYRTKDINYCPKCSHVNVAEVAERWRPPAVCGVRPWPNGNLRKRAPDLTSLILLRPIIALTRAQSYLSTEKIMANAWIKQESDYPGRIARSHGMQCGDLAAECMFRWCHGPRTKLLYEFFHKLQITRSAIRYQPRQE
jgi:hypothetical protein